MTKGKFHLEHELAKEEILLILRTILMASIVQKLVGPTQKMYKLHILNISTNLGIYVYGHWL